MKKLILILLAAVAFSCGDGSDRARQSGSEIETEDTYSDDALESDTTQMQVDTTGTGYNSERDTTATSPNNP